MLHIRDLCQLNSQGPFTFFTMGVAQKKRKVWYNNSVYILRRMAFFPRFGLRSDPNQLCYGFLKSSFCTLPHFNACNVPAPRSNPVTFFFAILSKRGRFSNSALCISFRLFPIDGQRFSRSAFHFGFNVLIFYSVE